MSAGEVDRTEFMKAVFGNKDRIDVWHTISQFPIEPPMPFLQKDIRDMTGLEPRVIHQHVHALHKLGAIQETSEPQYSGRFFVRTESPVWDIVAAAIEATRDMP